MNDQERAQLMDLIEVVERLPSDHATLRKYTNAVFNLFKALECKITAAGMRATSPYLDLCISYQEHTAELYLNAARESINDG